ncbi:TPA: hypothetical protein P2B70_004907, partial [Salmonella enterica subsp. enterica serovar Eastbourne]|nr:hypothetical protein [Salmonella enterica subsp. enterica serovar Eastbourne]HDN7577112.1 hypothetical protein [Salmonella enterica subsp. enterica serovar Eastbourne]
VPADQTAGARAQLAMLLEGIDWRQPKRLLTSLTMLQASLSWLSLNKPGKMRAYERHLF